MKQERFAGFTREGMGDVGAWNLRRCFKSGFVRKFDSINETSAITIRPFFLFSKSA
jgi:hypothetical protein